MGFLGNLLVALIVNVVTDELRAAQPWLIERLLRLAVRIAPAKDRERLHEEWAAYLDDTPGGYTKILRVSGFVVAALRCTHECQVLVRVEEASRRGFDIALSGAVLATLLPLLLALTLAALRLNRGSTAWVRQICCGRGGRPFMLLKIRTGREYDDAGDHLLSGEKRHHPLSRLLFDSGLFVLPMYINVLLGHISIIGPHILSINAAQELEKSQKREYFDLKPGLLCLSSLECGITQSQKIDLDIWYMKNRTLQMDFALIIHLVRRVLH